MTATSLDLTEATIAAVDLIHTALATPNAESVRVRCRCVMAPQRTGCPLFTTSDDGLCDPCRDRGCPPQPLQIDGSGAPS